jgi:hypothetical protein
MKPLPRLDITVVTVKQPKKGKMDKPEHYYTDDFVIKPDCIKVNQDDTTSDVYKRIPGSCYWRCVGLPDYQFALLVNLSI